MKIIHHIRLILLMLLSCGLFAQENKDIETGLFSQYEDVVYLKDGSVVKGVLLEKTPEFVKIETLGGSHFIFQNEEIEEVKIEKRTFDPSIAKELRPYLFNDEGWYSIVSMGFLPGIRNENQPRLGFTAHYSLGYHLKKRLGIEAGFGMDVYSLINEAEVIAPFYLQARGYLANRPSTPYGLLAVGYGTVVPRWNVTDSRGGLYFQPAIGMRVKSRRRVDYFIECGLKVQYAAYTISSWNGGTQIRKTWFRRSALKFGILF